MMIFHLFTQMAEGHVALKQKLNTIAVKCKDELHAPQEIMALVSNTVVPQNEQQRCYLECVYKNLNLIKNNKFSVEDGKAMARIRFANQPEEHKKAVTIIETCEKDGRFATVSISLILKTRDWRESQIYKFSFRIIIGFYFYSCYRSENHGKMRSWTSNQKLLRKKRRKSELLVLNFEKI